MGGLSLPKKLYGPILEHSALIEIACEYLVKEEFQGQFELAYGPGGAWSRLLGECAGYRGTSVLRDLENPLRYLTVDVWNSREDWEQALADKGSEYAELDAAYAEWTESERQLGVFRMLSEANVRPRPTGRRR